MSIRFIPIIASKARLALAGSTPPMSRVSCRGDNLPREAIAILDPAALLGLRHGRQRVAQAVDLGLRLDWNLERHRFVELEERPAVETREALSHQRELDHEHVARLARRIVARRAMDSVDTAVGQDRGIEVRGFLGRAVEPETRRDLGRRFGH